MIQPLNEDRGGEVNGEGVGRLTCLLSALPLVPQHACVAAALRPAAASSIPPTPWPDDPTDKSTCLLACINYHFYPPSPGFPMPAS